MSFVRHLKDDVTHWPVSGTDGFGGFTFGTPVLLKGRWQERAELFREDDNEERISMAIVYLNTNIAVGDYLGLGDSITTPIPTTLTTAHRVRQMHKTSDLRNLLVIRKVFL